MKLRNKKTGEIVTIGKELSDDFDGVGLMLWVNHMEGYELDDYKIYDSLAELNEEWEDYKPTEPLIKDEKIRKAVRAWTDVNGCDKLLVRLWEYCGHGAISFYDEDGDNEITFATAKTFGLEHLKDYTITELCGEEEE